MARTLRYLSVHPQPDVARVLGDNVRHLCWMYEHYALPYNDAGFAKLNVMLVADPERGLGGPRVDPFGRTAEVPTPFDVAAYAALSETDQQRYYAGRLHSGVLRCVGAFGWEQRPFDAAHDRMLADGLRFAFWWRRPLYSPDRRIRVQGYVEAATKASVWLVFTDRQGAELHRCLLAVTACGSGISGQVLGSLRWVDDATVRVVQANGRDYWLCTADGQPAFHYPRAEQGDAHGEFDLGRMYHEGGLLPPDRERGLTLIRTAAQKGYPHALRFLQRLEQEAAPPASDDVPPAVCDHDGAR